MLSIIKLFYRPSNYDPYFNLSPLLPPNWPKTILMQNLDIYLCLKNVLLCNFSLYVSKVWKIFIKIHNKVMPNFDIDATANDCWNCQTVIEQVSILPTFYKQLLLTQIPKAQKDSQIIKQYLLVLLGSACVKAAS